MKHKWLLFLIISIPAFADDLIMSNIPNGCSSDLNNHTFLYATFTRSQYTCSSGYYVPANTDHCVICPEYYDCNGGNFTFNEYIDQGNTFKTRVMGNIRNGCKTDFLQTTNDNDSNIIATFAPNVHTCTPGYYLPANIDECTKCLNNHYCAGGTYTFNETTADGITPCPSENPFAPAGMWLQSQCGRKLYVGNDVIYFHQSPAYPTTHRLFVRAPNGGTYSVNAIPKDINANTQPKMSAGMSKEFHIMMDNVEYLICDDSVPECRNMPPTN